MKLKSDRKPLHSPKVDLMRSSSYFDPKKVRKLYSSHSKTIINNPRDNMVEVV